MAQIDDHCAEARDCDLRRIAASSDMQDLFALARDTSIRARMQLVQVIGDLFANREEVLTERERALMNEILEKLVADFEMSVRRALAKRIADLSDAPASLVTILANDEIEVARPVLMKSGVLQDSQLIEVVCNRTRQHQIAIALRRDLSEPVSEALVENGSDDVIRTLLENQSAKISQATMEYLVDQARHVDTFQEPLINRSDLGGPLVERLYRHVSAALRVRIIETYDIDVTHLDDALEDVTREMADAQTLHSQVCSAGSPAAERLARRIAEEGTLDVALVIKVLRRGEIPLFEALMAEMSGIRPPRLQRILYEDGGKGLAVMCRALDIHKANFAPLFLLSRKGRTGEQVVDPCEVSSVMRFFDNVAPEAARPVLRRWQRSPEYLDAVEAIEEERLGEDPS